MATNTNLTVTDPIDALLTTTMRKYGKNLSNVIMRSQPLFYMLDEKGAKEPVDGGHKVQEPLIYGNNTTIKFFTGYETLNVDPQEGMTATEWAPYSMSGSVSISWEEEQKNRGAAALLGLLDIKVTQLQNSLRWKINDHLHGVHGASGKTHTGRDTNTKDSLGGANVDAIGFNSLDHIVRTKAGYAAATPFNVVCGGLTTSLDTDDLTATNPWWLNYSIPGYLRINFNGDCGAATPTATEDTWAGDIDTVSATTGSNLVNVMRAGRDRISDGDGPDMILSSQEVLNIYEMSQAPLERYTDRKLADAGFRNIEFSGIPMMLDYGISTALSDSGTAVPLYMLNTKYLRWRVWADFEQTPFFRPHNQAARTSQILLMAQLTCRNRQKQLVIACNT